MNIKLRRLPALFEDTPRAADTLHPADLNYAWL
jgi:hypothetical protein